MKHNVFETTYFFDNEAHTFKVRIRMARKYRRLLNISYRTKSWKSRIRILKRILDDMTVADSIAMYAKEEIR